MIYSDKRPLGLIRPSSTQEYQNLLEPGVKDDEKKDDNNKDPDDV